MVSSTISENGEIIVHLSDKYFEDQLSINVPNFLVEGKWTDISLTVIEKGSKATIDCHRIVLASCPFLKDILIHNEDATEIILDDVTKEDLDSFMTFVYTGIVNFPDAQQHDRFISLISNFGILLNRQEISGLVDPFTPLSPITSSSSFTPPPESSMSGSDIIEGLPLNDEFWILEEKDLLSTIDDSVIAYESPYFELDHLNPVPFTEVTNFEEKNPLEDNPIINRSNESSRTKKRKKYHCQFCDKAFPSNYYLRFHESSVHSKVKSFSCQYCGKVFSESYYLKQHERRMHSDGREFTCSVCSSSFSVRYDLVVHERIHASVKQYQCQFCNKTYSNQRALREHRRTHTGERPYPCRECGKRFALPKTLRVHYRQHSGERPYLCSICGMTFVQNSTLKNHLKSNHQQNNNKESK